MVFFSGLPGSSTLAECPIANWQLQMKVPCGRTSDPAAAKPLRHWQLAIYNLQFKHLCPAAM
jgi:hypothetical protein